MSHHEDAADRAVVVGVDGSPASVNALRYGIDEAARLGASVHVVHAVQTHLAMAPMTPLPLEDMRAGGRSVLTEALSRVGPVSSSVTLTATLCVGDVVTELAAACLGARLVVVGSDRRPVLARVFTGNVSTGIAASAGAPVVAIPETWQAARPTGAVLVGVKRPEHAEELLAEAFAVADARGSRLVVLHAWRLPSGYDDIIASRVDVEKWDGRARRGLEASVAVWRDDYPDVDVELQVVHDQAAHALVRASADVDEVVLVRRAHGVPAAVHLGSTARAVLAHALCPVRIVPGDRIMQVHDLTLEQAGALSR